MTSMQEILYLSDPAEVSMADQWFEVAALDHFWIQRRFDVFRRLARGVVPESKDLAEIGCGHGLLQRQVENEYSRGVGTSLMAVLQFDPSLVRSNAPV